jgi:hypothetical protein
MTRFAASVNGRVALTARSFSAWKLVSALRFVVLVATEP